MTRYVAVGALLAVALLSITDSVSGQNALVSGPQVGQNARPAAFTPLNLNGPTPNQKQCLV
jgi:hypothetical protein